MDQPPFFADLAAAPAPAKIIWLHTQDGKRLRAAFWDSGPKGMVAIFPGRTEVIEKYGRVVADLVGAGYGAAVIDWRGQGLSDRPEGKPLLGDVRDFAEYQQDVAIYLETVRDFAPDAALFMLAHSMGGCIGLRALINGFPARACAFSAPMWGLRLTHTTRRAVVAMTSLLGLARLDLREVPGAGVEFRLWENAFDNNELTRDRAAYAWMQAQVNARHELRLGPPSLRWLVAALAETAVLAQLPAPDVPTYCGLGTHEKLVSSEAIMARMETWPKGTLEIFEGALHELLMERPNTRGPFLKSAILLFNSHQP